MEARAFDSRDSSPARLTAPAAALALMFGEVQIATDRLALCLRTQRRIGSAHALLHLRRLIGLCLREGDAMRRLASTLAWPIKELDDALAADRLDADAVRNAEQRLSLIRFQLWRLELMTEMGASGNSGISRLATMAAR